MATVQINGQEQVQDCKVSVYFKWAWSDTWEYKFEWQPINAVHSAAPMMGNATFKLRYGSGYWEDGETMTGGDKMESLTYGYVQIRGQSGSKVFIMWTGIVTAEKLKILGKSGKNHTAEQILQAYSLDWLLQTRLEGAWVRPVGGGDPVKIDDMPVFNRRHRFDGSILGNRSVKKFGNSTHIFDTDVSTGGAVWSNWDIARYLLVNYQQSLGPNFILEADKDITECLSLSQGIYDFNRMTLQQALNILIDRARGLSWTYRVDENNTVTITPFSLLERNIKIGYSIIPSNKTTQFMDIWNSQNTEIEISESITDVYDEIIVRGAKMKSCFTVKFSDGSIEEGWSMAEEAAYGIGAFSMDGYAALNEEQQKKVNDLYRSTDRYKRVFTTFRIPRNWNWRVNGGDRVNPLLNSAAGATGSYQAPYWNADKRFLNYLPFLEGVDYSVDPPVVRNAAGSEPEFQKMFVLVKSPATVDPPEEGGDQIERYYYADKVEVVDENQENQSYGADIRPLNREMGFEMSFKPAYMAARNHFDVINDQPGVHTDKIDDIGIDYITLLATVFVETDQYVEGRYKTGDYENQRVKIIDIPDAELWFVVSGTVVGVCAEESIVNPFRTLSFYNGPNFIRDDRERLRQALAAAVAWYGVSHKMIEVKTKTIDAGIPLGQMLKTEQGASVVTTVSWNFDYPLETTIRTGFAELDVSEIFRKR